MSNRKSLVLAVCVGAFVVASAAMAEDASKITWKRTELENKFRAEGVAILDVNKDGKMDIFNGDVWFEAPDWKVHEVRPPARDYGDGAAGYSESFCCYVGD